MTSVKANKPIWFLIFNAVLFQVIWFVAVLFGDSWFLLFLIPILVMHFFSLHYISHLPLVWKNEIFLLLICLGIGFFVESLKLLLGVWSPLIDDIFPPLWLLAIWLGFGMSLHGSLGFLQSSFRLSLLLGLLVAPASYFAGARLSPSYELASPYSLVIISGLWAFVMPLLAYTAKQLPLERLQ